MPTHGGSAFLTMMQSSRVSTSFVAGRFGRNLVSMRLAERCVYFAFIYECLMLALRFDKIDLVCNQGMLVSEIAYFLQRLS